MSAKGGSISHGCLVVWLSCAGGNSGGKTEKGEDVHEMVWGMALSLQAVCRSKSYRVIGLVKDVSRYKHERNV